MSYSGPAPRQGRLPKARRPAGATFLQGAGLDETAAGPGVRTLLHLPAPVRELVAEFLPFFPGPGVHHITALEDAERSGQQAQLVELGAWRGKRVEPCGCYEVGHRHAIDRISGRLDRIADLEGVDRAIVIV